MRSRGLSQIEIARGEILAKGYPRLLAHTTAHYTTAEILYNEEAQETLS